MPIDLFLRRVEFALLLGLAAFLPALEAPKNICMGLYLIIWTINRLRSGQWGGAWLCWDTLVVVLIASGYLAAMFAGLPGRPLAAGNDILAYGLVFLTLRRSSFQAKQIWCLLVMLVVATLLTLGYGYWGYLVTKERTSLGLHSVGHVNHSAIYMAISFSVAFVATFVAKAGRMARLGIVSCALILGISVLVTMARGAIIPALLFALLWVLYWLSKLSSLTTRGRFAVLSFMAVVLLFSGTLLVHKTLSHNDLGQSNASGARPALARTALLCFRQYPFFGVGPTQFGKVNLATIHQWQSGTSRWFVDEDLAFGSHAHGLYTNTLAERGLVGLSVLLTLLVAWGRAIWFFRPTSGASSLAQVLWGSALGGWVMTVVGGLFNTTLHHEHAMITVVLIGLWMSWQREPAISA